MAKEINLTQGYVSIVDDEDYDFLNQWKWCYRQGYAIRTELPNDRNGLLKQRTVSIHRLINNTPEGMDTDHINGDKLDNRKINLRSCSHKNNTRNRSTSAKFAKKISSYKGVCWIGRLNKWQATIVFDGKQTYIGVFESEVDAATAYNLEASRLFGEYAFMNKAA